MNMNLPNEFLMQVNGCPNVTFYLRRADEERYRLRDARQSDEEAAAKDEFPYWSIGIVDNAIQDGTWIVTQNLDEPVFEVEVDLEGVL